MKWFKHYSAASEDEGLSHLEDEMGLEGYALFWKCVEIVASQMDETDRCHVEYSWSKWRNSLRINRRKLDNFLGIVQEFLSFGVTISEEKLRIEIPKLLELRDNHTKNLQATNKQLASKEVEVEVDKNKSNSNKRFTPPTLEEVKSYCKERNNNVDAQRFIDFYESKGWMVGRNNMKDWKAAIRNWERGSNENQQPKHSSASYHGEAPRIEGERNYDIPEDIKQQMRKIGG